MFFSAKSTFPKFQSSKENGFFQVCCYDVLGGVCRLIGRGRFVGKLGVAVFVQTGGLHKIQSVLLVNGGLNFVRVREGGT